MSLTFTVQIKGLPRTDLVALLELQLASASYGSAVEIRPPAAVPGAAPAWGDKVKLVLKDPVALASLVVSILSLGQQYHDRPAQPAHVPPAIELVLKGDGGQVTIRPQGGVDEQQVQQALDRIGALREIYIQGTE